MDTDSDHDDSYGFPSQESSTETFTPTPEGSCKNCKNTDFEAHRGAFYCTHCGYEEGPELVYDLYGTTSVYHGNWPENNENAINENLENLKAGDVIPQMGGEDGSSTLEKSGGSLRSQYGTLKEGSVGHGKSGGPQWHVDSQESSTETPAFTPTPEGIDASVATDEKDVIDASVSTDTKDVIDASVSTDTKEVCDVFVETDAKENLQDFQQQTDVEDAKIKLKEFLNVMKDLSISDLTGVIIRAAQAINDKSLL